MSQTNHTWQDILKQHVEVLNEGKDPDVYTCYFPLWAVDQALGCIIAASQIKRIHVRYMMA